MGHTKKIFLKTVPEIVHNNLNRVFYFSERENLICYDELGMR
jgi:hypothetical protein